ncbi:MAG: Cbb3-type cytochrome c oxidase subunit CcoP [Planctomycetota bacterium]|jgi:cytochrome c oxidase cbb3-type subunit III
MSAENHGARQAATEPRILDHDCDGIREYDNPMPFWWSAIFWVTMIFALPYFAFYHLGGVGTSLSEDYNTEMGEFYEMQAARLGNLKPDESTILTLSTDRQKLLAGQNMFKANCATCHAPDGGGKTGPNLTDDFYINVRKPEDVFRVVRDGIEAKGMPRWGKRFSEPQLVLLSSYVVSLRGTSPASPLKAQGDQVGPWAPAQGAQHAAVATQGQ